jgi:hypothetical protein
MGLRKVWKGIRRFHLLSRQRIFAQPVSRELKKHFCWLYATVHRAQWTNWIIPGGQVFPSLSRYRGEKFVAPKPHTW